MFPRQQLLTPLLHARGRGISAPLCAPQELVREHPLLLGVQPDQARRVLGRLQAAGLAGEDLHERLKQYPGILGRE